MTDIAHELAGQVLDRGEDPARHHLAFDAGKPQFDLIEPRGVGRGEMQVQLGIIGEELCDPLGLCAARLSAMMCPRASARPDARRHPLTTVHRVTTAPVLNRHERVLRINLQVLLDTLLASAEIDLHEAQTLGSMVVARLSLRDADLAECRHLMII
jgi:hypothetical protein